MGFNTWTSGKKLASLLVPTFIWKEAYLSSSSNIYLERSLPVFFHQHLFGKKLACGSLEQRSAWWTPGCNWISWELEKLWLYLGWCYLLSFWSWWTPDHKNSRMHTLTSNCAINIKEVHYDIINIKEVHLNRITCCQGWNKSGRCPAPQSSASDPASTFLGPGNHIKIGTWKTCPAVKGIVHNFFHYRSNLIFWIVMGCGIADFGRRGL